MGLDATVRCNCYEQGELKPGPVPYEDLYIDADGYLSSKMLDAERERLDRRRFDARYGDLERSFNDWTYNCCDHEDGDYCLEWVSNWAGCAQFASLLEEAGGAEEFPLLSTLLPDGNGGTYPTEKAEATLEELDRFIAKISAVDEWVLIDAESEEDVWNSTDSGAFTWMVGPCSRVSMVGSKVVFEHNGYPTVETSHFKQIPIEKTDSSCNQRMRIVCLETGVETEAFDSIGPEGSPKTERELLVTSKKAPFLFEGKYWTAERIRNLLEASIETGNPIRWC